MSFTFEKIQFFYTYEERLLLIMNMILFSKKSDLTFNYKKVLFNIKHLFLDRKLTEEYEEDINERPERPERPSPLSYIDNYTWNCVLEISKQNGQLFLPILTSYTHFYTY